MIEAIEANESKPKAWSLACRFICVFHRITPGTTTKARSVTIVLTVAQCPMMTNVSTGAHFVSAVGFHIPLTGLQYSSVPTKVMAKDAHVTNKSAYTVRRMFIFWDAMRMMVMQIDDLTVASARTYTRIQMI